MTPTIQQLEGRSHLVTPVVLGCGDDVWQGSAGALLYPADELKASSQKWNGKPVVIFHPMLMNAPVAAGHPDVFNKQKVGHVFNVAFDKRGGKLVGDAWLDIARMNALDPDLYQRIKAGKQVAVSTGLFTDNEPRTGIARNGKRYDAVARNHAPDHLAILPGKERGAAEGAFLNRNQQYTAPRLVELFDDEPELVMPSLDAVLALNQWRLK